MASARRPTAAETPPSCRNACAVSTRPLTLLQELRQRVLEQRQRGLHANFGQDLRHQCRLDLETDRASRLDDRVLELRDRWRSDRLSALGEQVSEGAIEQRPVIEICAQGHDHSQAGAVVGDRGAHAIQEEGADLLVDDEREELFELIDQQYKLGVACRQNNLCCLEDPVLVLVEYPRQTDGLVTGNAGERRRELRERIRARMHGHAEPALRSGDGTSS